MNKYKAKVEVLTQTGDITHWIDFEIIVEAEDHKAAISKIEAVVAPAEPRITEMKIQKPYTYKVKDS